MSADPDEVLAAYISGDRMSHDELIDALNALWCTCGMGEQERTGHAPRHDDWCEVAE